jgi:hypothetical protein
VKPETRYALSFGAPLLGLAALVALGMAFDIHLGNVRQSDKYAALETDSAATAQKMQALGKLAEANERAWNLAHGLPYDHARPLTEAEQRDREWAAAELKRLDEEDAAEFRRKHPNSTSQL